MKTQPYFGQPQRGGDAYGAGEVSLRTGSLQAAATGRTDASTEPAPNRADKDVGALPTPVEIDGRTGLPVLPRFPWLSRRSLALEEAARRRAAFGPGPLPGELVDTLA